MKEALVLGTLAGQVDAIEALKARGVQTHACGHVQRGPGVEAADEFHLVDITDVEAVSALAVSIEADLVYSVGSDIAMPTVTAVSEELGLPCFHGVALTDVLRRKQELRVRLARAGLSPVQYASVEPGQPDPAWGVFPAIVKPVDSQGQRGITVVESEAELPAAIATARASAVSGAVIIEELLRGPEVSAHVIVGGGEVLLFLPSDRHVWDGPLIGTPQAHSLPLRAETAVWEEEFRALAEQVVTALGVQDGPLYFQVILTESGPRIVEIASRLDGCHLWRLVKLSTGIDILDAVLGRLLGEPWPNFPQRPQIEPMTLEFLLSPPDDVVTEEYYRANVHPEALYVERQVAVGELPRRTNDVIARVGYEVYGGIPE